MLLLLLRLLLLVVVGSVLSPAALLGCPEGRRRTPHGSRQGRGALLGAPGVAAPPSASSSSAALEARGLVLLMVRRHAVHRAPSSSSSAASSSPRSPPSWSPAPGAPCRRPHPVSGASSPHLLVLLGAPHASSSSSSCAPRAVHVARGPPAASGASRGPLLGVLRGPLGSPPRPLPPRGRRLLPGRLGPGVADAQKGRRLALEVQGVPLQRVERDRRVGHGGKLDKEEEPLALLLDEPQRLVALEGPEDVGDLAALCVRWEPLDVEGRGRGLRGGGRGDGGGGGGGQGGDDDGSSSSSLLEGVHLLPRVLLLQVKGGDERLLLLLLLDWGHNLRDVGRGVVLLLLQGKEALLLLLMVAAAAGEEPRGEVGSASSSSSSSSHRSGGPLLTPPRPSERVVPSSFLQRLHHHLPLLLLMRDHSASALVMLLPQASSSSSSSSHPRGALLLLLLLQPPSHSSSSSEASPLVVLLERSGVLPVSRPPHAPPWPLHRSHHHTRSTPPGPLRIVPQRSDALLLLPVNRPLWPSSHAVVSAKAVGCASSVREVGLLLLGRSCGGDLSPDGAVASGVHGSRHHAAPEP